MCEHCILHSRRPGWVQMWGAVGRCRIRGGKAASQRHGTVQQFLSSQNRMSHKHLCNPEGEMDAFSPKGELTAILTQVGGYTVTSWALPNEAQDCDTCVSALGKAETITSVSSLRTCFQKSKANLTQIHMQTGLFQYVPGV